jgi:hypothetical protein
MQQDLAGVGGVGLAMAAGFVVEPRSDHPGVLLVEGHPEGAAGGVDVEGHEGLPVTGAGDVGGDGPGEAPEPSVLHVEDPQTVAGAQAEGLRSGCFPLGEALSKHGRTSVLTLRFRPASPPLRR